MLLTKEYRTLSYIAGPLLFVERVRGVGYAEMVDILTPGGIRRGQVLEVDGDRAVIQSFAGTYGLDVDTTRVRFTGEVARLGVSLEMLGRTFDGTGEPIDGGPPILADEERDINGQPINPFARDHPSEFIQTGISAIDGLNTLVRGQKLPIFSGFGLPANEIAAQIATQATVRLTADHGPPTAAPLPLWDIGANLRDEPLAPPGGAPPVPPNSGGETSIRPLTPPRIGGLGGPSPTADEAGTLKLAPMPLPPGPLPLSDLERGRGLGDGERSVFSAVRYARCGDRQSSAR